MRRETGAITETASEEEEEECEGKTELIFLYKNPQTKDWGGGDVRYEAPLWDRRLSPQSAPSCIHTSVLLLIRNPR